MKFRYKVLIINIIFLSIGIGVVGFFMIDKNFKLALQTQIENAVEENNIIQANIEYYLLASTSQKPSITEKQIENSATNLKSSMANNNLKIALVYDNEIVYSDCPCPEELWQQSEIGEKKYIIAQNDDKYYIYVSSYGNINNAPLNIINQKDITAIFEMSKNQTMYFRYLLAAVVIACSVGLYIVSRLLTKPLEELNRASKAFGEGDYKTRVTPHSSDEVGTLAQTYNNMADAVEEHVEELNDMIVRQDQFVSDFTHEIKTPLTSIIGYSDTLRSKEVSRETQILASSYIFSEGKRLEAMSMKLFDLIYTKHHSIKLDPFHVKQLSEHIITSIAPAMEDKQIKLETQFEDAVLYGDIELLESAFINLLDNARKASKTGSTIKFNGAIKQDKYIINVQDFGIGISEEHINRICDEFYMVNKSRSRSEGGAGLGLSLASLIFKCHNANLDIESTLGEGTTMTISLPTTKPEKEDVSNEEN